ncbi:voltage-dependent calcium channel gamma-1 subunit [Marmota marmota marmota]|uniref:voltage-dependent calcium channel gamma-1 subunit n=1 Tax=Marmota marmota marmota TaxID=9994 RepID=UPI0020938435|nr:voltage-dependent calcium channel gamma-1 subunit [Marmota marmota marmota]
MSQTQALKVRVALFCILVGIVLAMVAVVTDFWAVLSPHMEHNNATCEAAHFGLWRICTTRVPVDDIEDKNCGAITLPGGNVPTLQPALPLALPIPLMSRPWEGRRVSRPGVRAATRPFLRRLDLPVAAVPVAAARLTNEGICLQLLPCGTRTVTELAKGPASGGEALGMQPRSELLCFAEYSISAAAIAIFSLGFIIVGTICALLSFRKKRDYLLRPASMFYAFAGLCIFVSVEVMRQSVKRMIDSEDTVWIEYYYSWSFACACAAFVLLFLGGLALLLFSLPRMPQNPWESCMDAEPEH